jgi:hypothetical protein
MSLKGCFWHKGSNGLGVGPKWLRAWLPYRILFNSAAVKHDSSYDIKGGNWYLRAVADLGFLHDMLKVSCNMEEKVMALAYYILVRMFGWMFYRYDR